MGLLRLILALCVAIGHLHLPRSLMLGGGEAVKIFFMISGFYMTLVLSKKYSPETWAGRYRFWAARYLRLYPVYICTLLMGVFWYLVQIVATGGKTPLPALLEVSHLLPVFKSVWLWFINLSGFAADIPSLIGLYLPDKELVLIGQNYEKVLNGSEPNILWLGKAVMIAQYWSVGSEMWFYLLAPFVVSLSWLTLAGLWVASYFLGQIWTATSGNSTYFFTPYLLIFFLNGIVAYRIYEQLSLSGVLRCLPFWIRAFLYGSTIVWTVALPIAGIELHPTLLYSIAFVSIPILFSITSSNMSDRQIGDLSYPLYVSHLLSFNIIANIFHRFDLDNPIFSSVASVTVALGVSLFLDKYVQVPSETLRTRFSASKSVSKF